MRPAMIWAPSGASTKQHPPRRVPAEVPYRRYVMPSSSTSPPVAADAEHAAYNAYLARLAGQAAPEDDG